MSSPATDLGPLPNWNLDDLYAGGIESKPLQADLKRARAWAERLSSAHAGKVAALSGDELGALIADYEQLQCKELSYNNINDTDAAYECVGEFDAARTAACVIVKHANPCGVAEGGSLLDAYRKALACDSVSAFGGIQIA